jgi:hypothetical protein
LPSPAGLVLIPTVAVPVAITLHVISLTQLRHRLLAYVQQPGMTSAADPAAA